MSSPDFFPDPLYKGSVTDHGLLTGLADDDHTIYFLADGTRTLTGGITQSTGLVNAFGKCRVGHGSGNAARFGHVDFTTSSNYAIQQDQDADNGGTLHVNAPSGSGGILLEISGGAVLTVSSATLLTAADAVNLALGTTTGTKFGTATSQKLAFYNATPIVQQTAVAVTAAGIHAALVNLGLITA